MHKAVRRFARSVGAPHVVPPAGFRDFRGWLIRLSTREVRPIWDQLLAALARDTKGDIKMMHAMKEDVVREIVKCVVVPRPDESAKLVSTNAGRQASRPRSGTTLMTVLDQQMVRVMGNGSGSSGSSSRGVSQLMAEYYPTTTMNVGTGYSGGAGGGSGRLTLAAAAAAAGRPTATVVGSGTMGANGTNGSSAKDMVTSASGLPTSSSSATALLLNLSDGGGSSHNNNASNSSIVNSVSSPHLLGSGGSGSASAHNGRATATSSWGQRQRSSMTYGRQVMVNHGGGGGMTGTDETMVGNKREQDREREKTTGRGRGLPSFRELDASLRRGRSSQQVGR